MKWWPWRGPEVRSSSYTEQVVSRLLASASGAVDGSSLAALETASRIWGAGLSSATVKPENNLALRSVSPVVLDAVGRGLCRSGESLHVIAVRNGQVSLTPCGSWSVHGGDDPTSWRYSCSMSGPSTTRTITVEAASVLHIRYAPSPASPWRGRSPVQLALDTFKAASLLEGAAKEEFSFTQKQLIAPRRGSGDFAPIDSLSPDVITKIVESFAQHVGAPTIVLPADVVPSRLGPSPPDSFAALRDRFEQSILAACGIAPSLIAAQANGTALREGFRQILHSLLKPLGALVAAELREKLDPAAALDFSELRAGDIVGTSRALGSLVKAGLSPAAAAAIVGISDVEVTA